MKMIAAMQARSDTVRGAPPRAREGGGGSSGCKRCHSASGSRRSAKLFIAGDHHPQLTAQTSSGMSTKHLTLFIEFTNRRLNGFSLSFKKYALCLLRHFAADLSFK
jgi:hypothetical protein